MHPPLEIVEGAISPDEEHIALSYGSFDRDEPPFPIVARVSPGTIGCSWKRVKLIHGATHDTTARQALMCTATFTGGGCLSVALCFRCVQRQPGHDRPIRDRFTRSWPTNRTDRDLNGILTTVIDNVAAVASNNYTERCSSYCG